MELTTLETVPGKTITRHLGLVQGSTVRSKHVGKDILAGLKNFVGGELKSYTALLNESRSEAVERMVEQARAAGANAIVNVRFSTSNIAAGAAEVMATARPSSSADAEHAVIELAVFVVLLAIGLFFGHAAESKHLRELAVLEDSLGDIVASSGRGPADAGGFRSATLVVGSVVIAEDYFKRVAAVLKGLVGGRIGSYESLLERGRREAIVRMKEQARRLGAVHVVNVRLETASLSEDWRGGQPMFSAEFIAYGTALVPARAAD